ncbi:hypothetical protein PHYPO_G00125460 [Pangasianodon hypophthalmus]|uniref:Uncharacterized protein n=1 Tax=Pangasianodon hypophthalmus TaxID=310915 RepID=A0A5N5KRA0_PANHP|nr:hypothetical protein PHYPO_G00125460 [Pangasianodon hypophthalmus]
MSSKRAASFNLQASCQYNAFGYFSRNNETQWQETKPMRAAHEIQSRGGYFNISRSGRRLGFPYPLDE